MGIRSAISNGLSATGRFLDLPEFGLSEAISGGPNGKMTNINPGLSATQSLAQLQGQANPGNQVGQTQPGPYTDPTNDYSGANSIYDPALIAKARGTIGNDQTTINNLYSAITGGLGQYATAARQNVDNAFNPQFDANTNGYTKANNQIVQNYGNNGTYDSSYRQVAQNDAQNAYDTSNKSLTNQRDAAYGGIGSTINGVQSQLQNKPQYDLSQYTDVNSLTDLHNQLGSYIQQLQGTQNQLQPNSALVQKLNTFAPIQNDLSQKLSALVSSSAPQSAKMALAQGYINQSALPPDQQSYWNNFFSNLMTTQAPQDQPLDPTKQLQSA